MKKLIIIILFPLFISAQVGINTTTPTKELDVNGELRVRNIPSMSSTEYLVKDVDGNIGYSSGGSGQVITIYPTTYMEDPFGISIWSEEYTTNIANWDLGFEQTITIPDGTSGWIKVEYYMPIGAGTGSDVGVTLIAYQGACLFKDNVLIENECSKMNINANSFVSPQGQNNGVETLRCNFVQNSYKEYFTEVADGNDTTITFEVQGYIEHYYKSTPINEGIGYWWGMWDDIPNNNYAWGRASLDIEVIQD
tara:strand:- start:17728 stop:18480 length:753 start_codon:yes stop_codon:yes gene_type:complete